MVLMAVLWDIYHTHKPVGDMIASYALEQVAFETVYEAMK